MCIIIIINIVVIWSHLKVLSSRLWYDRERRPIMYVLLDTPVGLGRVLIKARFPLAVLTARQLG